MTFDRTQRYDQQVREHDEAVGQDEELRSSRFVVDSGVELPEIGPNPRVLSAQQQDVAGYYAAVAVNEYGWDTATAAQRGATFASIHAPNLDPETMELFGRSAVAAIGLLEMRGILPDEMPLKQGLIDGILNATEDQLNDFAAHYRNTDRRLQQEDAHTVVFGDLTESALLQAGADPDLAAIADPLFGIGNAVSNVDLLTPGGRVIDRVDGTEMTYLETDGILEADIDGAKFIVELDGPIGDMGIDALAAITNAMQGSAHTLIQADELPGNENPFASFVAHLTDPVFQLKDKIDGPLNIMLGLMIGDLPAHGEIGGAATANRSEALMDAAHTKLVDQATVESRIEPDDLPIILASSFGGDGLITSHTVEQAEFVLSQMSAEEQAQLADDYSPSREQVQEAVEGLEDDRHSVKRALDGTADRLFRVADWWERFVQTNVISAVDFLRQFGEGLEGFGVGTQFGERQTAGEGFAAFEGVFDWAEGSAAFRGEITMADYLEVDEEWRGVTNLTTSLLGDPFAMAALGGVGRRLLMEDLMTSVAGQQKWLRTVGRPHVRRWEGMLKSDMGDLMVAMDSGLGPEALMRVRTGTSLTKVLEDSMADGLWLPTLGGRTKMRDTASNVARMMKLADGDTAASEWMRRNLAQWDMNRTVRLSPDGFFDDELRLLAAASTDFSAIQTKALYDELLELTSRRNWADNVAAMETEQLYATRRGLATQAQDAGLRSYWDDAARQLDLEDQIAIAVRRGDDDLAESLRTQLPRQADETVDMAALADDWSRKWQENTAGLEQVRRLRRNLTKTNQRAAYTEFHNKVWDEWFDHHGLLSSNGHRQTAKVAGRGTGAQESKLVEQMMAISEVTPKQAELMEAAGLLTVPSRAMHPVTPLRMVAYGARSSDSFWAKNMRPVMHRASQVDSILRKGFTANVLLNPFTWVRSNLDEPLRHGLQRGWLGRPSRIAELDRVPGATEAGARRLGASFGIGGPPEISVPYSRTLGSPIQGATAPEYVGRSKASIPGHLTGTVDRAGTRRAAQSLWRTLSNQPLWKQYADQALSGNVDEFVTFWRHGGGNASAQPVKRITAQLADDLSTAKPVFGDLTPHEVLNGLDEIVDAFVMQAPESARDTVRAGILRSLSTGEPTSEYVARQFTFMPAFEARDSSHYGRAFQRFFGHPAEVHGGLVWTDFYEQSRFMLEKRHADRILTPEILARKAKVTVEEADRMLWASSDEVMDIVAKNRMFTPKQIHVQSSRTATVHAEHMAYKMGSATLFGQKLARVFPFLKAQLDFAGYYSRELMSGTAIGLNPGVQSAIKGLGLKAPAGGFLPYMPFNLRLAGRIGDYAGTLTTLSEDEDGDVFQTVMDKYTFLPSSVGDSIWVQLAPGLAPVPSWALHMLPLEDAGGATKWGAAIRDFFDAALPGFEYFEDRANMNPVDLTRGGGAFVFGDGASTMRRAVDAAGGTMVATADDIFGWEFSETWSSQFGAPPGFHTELRVNLALALADNPEMVAKLEDGTFRDFVGEITKTTYRDTLGGHGTDYLEGLARKAGVGVNADDAEYLKLYEGMMEDFDDLRAQGFVDDRQNDEILRLWAEWETGTLGGKQATRLADQLSDVLFGMDDLLQSEMILLHPELVGNMVSQWKADPLAAPEGSFVGDRLVARPGEEGRELREQGKREGWLTRREPHDLAIGMWSRYGDAVVDMRNYLWEAATGLKSFSAGYGEGESRRIPEGYRPAEALGIPAGNYSRDELYALLVESTGVVSKNFTPYAGNTAEQQITGTDTMIEIDRLKGLARDHGLTDDPRTWPEEARQMGRDAFEAAINNPWSRFGTALAQVSTGQQVVVPREFTVTDYNRDLAPYWGELDYEAPVPPVLEDVPVGATDETYRLTVDPKDLVVIDGDTVAIEYDPAGRVGNQLAQAVADGPFTKTSDDAQRIRLIGVNAAERNEVTIVEGDTSYADQTNALQDIVRRAESIDFVVFDTEAFGTLQTVEADEVRWLMVMYVDGQPLWDPEVFTSVSPGGAGLGGNGVLNLDIKLREGV